MENPTANFKQAVRRLARRFELPALWQWWTGELARALPAASVEDLQVVDGIGAVRARSVRERHSRLADTSVIESFI